MKNLGLVRLNFTLFQPQGQFIKQLTRELVILLMGLVFMSLNISLKSHRGDLPASKNEHIDDP